MTPERRNEDDERFEVVRSVTVGDNVTVYVAGQYAGTLRMDGQQRAAWDYFWASVSPVGKTTP